MISAWLQSPRWSFCSSPAAADLIAVLQQENSSLLCDRSVGAFLSADTYALVRLLSIYADRHCLVFFPEEFFYLSSYLLEVYGCFPSVFSTEENAFRHACRLIRRSVRNSVRASHQSPRRDGKGRHLHGEDDGRVNDSIHFIFEHSAVPLSFHGKDDPNPHSSSTNSSSSRGRTVQGWRVLLCLS